MTEKARLLHALFGHPEREHINIKFFRGVASDVTTEDMCREAANGIEQILTDLAQPVQALDADTRDREVAELIAAL